MTSFWDSPIYELPQVEKQQALLAQLNELTTHHQQACVEYQRMLSVFGWGDVATDYQQLPYLAARLFKHKRLKSVSDGDVFKVMTSSGTTGAPSQIVLDKDTAALQSRVLVKIMQQYTGKQRLPMLLVEQPAYLQGAGGQSARGAGAVGLSFLGRDHHYAIGEDMSVNWPVVDAFFQKYAGQPVLIFGFTFMLWKYLLEPMLQRGTPLPATQGVLFHSGGWKKMQHLAIDNPTFKGLCRQWLGIQNVHNFYGMIEQVGSVFVECEAGHLHSPAFSDILIRNPLDFTEVKQGDVGLIQVMSAIPTSYPGHAILTEDLGRILGEDDCSCGRKGRYFEVLGRQQGAEVRGCSDTFR